MVVSAYQINNVIRVYGDQIRHGRAASRMKMQDQQTNDRLTLSSEAKRQYIVDKIASDIVNRITQYGPNEDVEKEVFEKLESEYGGQLALEGQESKRFVFKEIGEDGETISSLSSEKNDLLNQRLMEISKETISQNMI